MASSSSALPLILLSLAPLWLFSITPQVEAQSAPAPAPPGQINVTGILDKGGQFTTLIRLLTSSQVINQIENQLNSSAQGMTILAPTDNAFSNLKAGTLNGLSQQKQIALILYHILPKYYSLVMLQTVSNPVRTQASGMDGGAYGLNFTSAANQVNVSTGVVDTQLNNALRQDFPLAVYQVDKVLLPADLFGPKPPKSAPAPSDSADDTPKKAPSKSAGEPSPAKDSNSGAEGRSVGLGLVLGIALMCMGVLSS